MGKLVYFFLVLIAGISTNPTIAAGVGRYYSFDTLNRSVALVEIKDRKNQQKVEAALDLLKADGFFDKEAASILFNFLNNEKRPDWEKTRDRVAHIFYILFYDLKSLVTKKAVVEFLGQDENKKLFRLFLINDRSVNVKVSFAQTSQIMINPFKNPNLPEYAEDLTPEERSLGESLAINYVPILLDSLLAEITASDSNIRNEVLVALDNFSASDYMKDPKNLKKLIEWYQTEPDEDYKSFFEGHPYIEAILTP